MQSQEFTILLRLITAHLLADFTLQPDRWVKDRKVNQLKSRYFWMHIAVVATITYLLLGMWSNWQAPLVITISHLLIDVIKTYFSKDTTKAFVLDQLAHLLVIFFIWLIMTAQVENFGVFASYMLEDEEIWLVMLGYLINTIPLSVLIRYLTRKWSRELDEAQGTDKFGVPTPSLKDAGKWIGIVERLLIFTFILFDELRSIGFLLAAKSVFRFGDLKDSTDRKKTEYILIGTLISFASSIFTGLLIVKFLG